MSDEQSEELAELCESRDARDLILSLRARGWSNHRIAALVGLSESTVYRVSAMADTEHTIGRDGKTRPARKPSDAEMERRRDVAAALARDGFKRRAIAAALGVSESTVNSDLRARHVTQIGTRLDAIPPERAYWRNSEPSAVQPRKRRRRRLREIEPPPEVPGYVTTRVLDLLERFHGDFVDGDYANQFAWLCDEAHAAVDDERAQVWLSETRTLLVHVHDEVGRLQRIVSDERYRHECRATEEGREALRRKLRIVP